MSELQCIRQHSADDDDADADADAGSEVMQVEVLMKGRQSALVGPEKGKINSNNEIVN
jgi:hypothetical protein